MVKVESSRFDATIIEPDFLIAHSLLSLTLMDLLYGVVDTMEAVADAVNLLPAVQELVRFYITPHVLDPVSSKELPLGQNSKPLVEGLALSLPALLLPSVQKKLHSLS
ncbi:hypothetical protein PG994_014577 [Apiospora phragmitis]|uniref:Uncharacterized protein n=1 Tax=Apiospora phragmitis TaxID=2905665 RepID=A0ABR1T6J5_9PEZI